MSDSTPGKTPTGRNTDRPADRGPAHPQLGGTSGWWVVSVIIHGLVLLALLAFTPLRTIILEPGKSAEFETTANADRIEEIVAEIRDHQAAEIAFEVEELVDIADTLADIRETKLEDYDNFADELVDQAPSKTQAAQDEALKAQQEALDALDAARKADEKAGQAHAQAQKAQPDAAAAERMAEAAKAQAEAKAAHAKARDAQLRADEAQTKAAQLLSMLDEAMKPALDAQRQAIKAQADATAAEIEADQRETDSRSSQRRAAARQAGIPERQRKVAELSPKAEQLKGEADKLAGQYEQAKRKADEAKKAYEAARTAATNAGRAVSKARTPEAKNAAQTQYDAAKKQTDDRRKLSDQAQAEARKLEGQSRDARSRLSRASRGLDGAKKQLDKAVEEAKRSQGEAAQRQKAASDATAMARDAQANAMAAQKKAKDTVAKVMSSGAPIAAVKSHAQIDSQPDRTRPNLFDKNVADLYDLAVKTERRSTEEYKDVRAADLAIIRHIPLAEARDQTDVAKPLRPELDRKLLTGSIRDLATADRHKKEVETAIREIRSMVTLGRRMLETAQAGQADGAAAMSLDWYRAKAAQAEEMTRAAMEDDGAVAKDMSGLMRAAAAASDGGTEGKEGAAAAASGSGLEGQAKPSGADQSRRGGRSFGPPTIKRDLKAIPGRKVLTGGMPAKWMYVDSWYVLGPFPNPKRVNRDKKFPPESVVDLDAKYIGKDGKVIRWEFMQTSEPEVLPPDAQEYAIYYAYTELWFEKAMDLWIAVGSDDKSSLWIEDQPVWVSGNQLKAWQIAEGMRRVHFKKGLNRILYRIENGWQHVGWSLVIHTDSPGATK